MLPRILAIFVLALLPLAAHAQEEQQALVDRATLTLEEMIGQDPQSNKDRIDMLRQAKAVMICPRVFRAGFFIGGAGGDCVLTARDGAGSWSDPAFYTMGSASFGLQIGIQDAEIILMILTERGLNAILNSQFKVGADASVSFVVLGAGVEGATTAALRADIVAFAKTRGLYAGISLNGSIFSSRSSWNEKYYGKPVGARDIVMLMQVHNPGANPLRATLGRLGAKPTAPTPIPEDQNQIPTPPAPPAQASAPRGQVQQENLPTPLQPQH
ncbi:MAG: lipid-binding SYLF domain-containing protein [Acidobacteriia bacterium]|nr:lipid-binding SYLF domain-containing protein [Methyloceanibacter sp.]MCL6491766.1 lipid-binding SYLF domain-containing protein [Terriglobia bacterium]